MSMKLEINKIQKHLFSHVFHIPVRKCVLFFFPFQSAAHLVLFSMQLALGILIMDVACQTVYFSLSFSF